MQVSCNKDKVVDIFLSRDVVSLDLESSISTAYF